MYPPSINSFPQDDNPNAGSQSMTQPQASGWVGQSVDKLLGFFLAKDRQDREIEMRAQGASVAGATAPMFASLQPARADLSPLVLVFLGVAGVAGIVWLARR